MTLCKSCGKEIRRVTINGTRRWGHVENPTFQRHYPAPRQVAEPSETERRAQWGDR